MLQRTRRAKEEGFTLLEIIVAMAVLGILLVPLFAAFIQSLKMTDKAETQTGASQDSQLIASYWTKDVHNVERSGISYDGGCPSLRATGPDDTATPLVTFRWDTQTSTGELDDTGELVLTPKKVTWLVEGEGKRARIIRRYCENDLPVAGQELTVADSFGEVDRLASQLVSVECSETACTIRIDGRYRYNLTVERRVPGLAPDASGRPPAPELVGVLAGNTSLTANWLPSVVPEGFAPVTKYQMKVFRQGADDGEGNPTLGPFESPAILTPDGSTLSGLKDGLVNGRSYCIVLSAYNELGWGPDGAINCDFTPAPVAPGAPTGVEVEWATAPDAIDVSWTEPRTSGGAFDDGGTQEDFEWTIRGRDPDSNEVVVIQPVSGAAARTATVTGLTQGEPVVFSVSAANAAGEGAESEPSEEISPCGIPGAPGQPTAEKAIDELTQNYNGRVRIEWLPPEGDGGCKVDHYELLVSRNGEPFTALNPGSSDPAPDDGPAPTEFLTADLGASVETFVRYQFKVITVNAAGHRSDPSVASADVNFDPRPIQAPFDIEWTPAWFEKDPPRDDEPGGEVRWVPLPNVPAFNGGFTITNYRWRLTNLRTGQVRDAIVWGDQSTVDVWAEAELAFNFPGTFGQTTGSGATEAYENYKVEVAAENLNGPGPWASIDSVNFGGRPLKSPEGLSAEPRSLDPPVVRLSWTPLTATELADPDVNGGRTVTGYTPVWNGSGSPFTNGTGTGDGRVDIGQLTKGQSYDFSITTQNDIGRSIPTAASKVTRRAPSNLVAPDSSTLTLSRPAGGPSGRLLLNIAQDFTDNLDNPARAFTARCTSPDDGNALANFTLTAGIGIKTLDGLTNGIRWECDVTATVSYPGWGSVGPQTDSATRKTNNAVVPYGLPSAPGKPTVSQSATGGFAVVNWTAPASNGKAITHYEISSPGFGTWVDDAADTSFTTPVAMTFGQSYTFTVRARNDVADGWGPTSPASDPFAAQQTVPSVAPQNLIWTPVYANKLRVDWTPVANTSPGNGGTDITGQVVRLTSPHTSAVEVQLAPGATSHEFTTPQVNGSGAIIEYTVNVRAKNAEGEGPAATTSAKAGGGPLAGLSAINVEPYTPDGGIQVYWTPIVVPPASPAHLRAQVSGAEGRTITGYNVYWRPASGVSECATPGQWKRIYASGSSAFRQAFGAGSFVQGTNYDFRVVATNNNTQSTNECVAAADDSALSSPTVQQISAGRVTPSTQEARPHNASSQQGFIEVRFAAWTVPNGARPITEYVARCRAGAGPQSDYTVVPGGGFNAINVNNLGPPGTAIQCQILAKQFFPRVGNNSPTTFETVNPAVLSTTSRS